MLLKFGCKSRRPQPCQEASSGLSDRPGKVLECNGPVVDPAIKELVCEKCWMELFGTRDYWNTCTVEPKHTLPEHDYSKPDLPTRFIETTMSQLELSRYTCNWCSLVHKTVLQNYFPEDYEEEGAAFVCGIAQTKRKHQTPVDMNDWVVSIAQVTKPDDIASSIVDAYTDKSDKASLYITARKPQMYLQTTSVMPEVNVWLEECKLHRDCPKQDDVLLPTRVVDVGIVADSRVKLWRSVGATGRYAALSYCWGGPQHCALTLANNQQYHQGIDITKLSKTIRDAIQVARAVGCRYLWVDALCIVQDSSKDKLHEIANMDQVYSNAHFTILAESALSAAEGFLPSKAPDLAPHTIPFRCPDGNFGSISLNYDDRWHEYPDHIATRAWTLQERLLSPRLLRFNARTLTWQCRSTQRNLGDSSFIRPNATTLDVSATSIDNWEYILYDYTRRFHSDPADKLTALGAIAKARAVICGSRYYAGLWENDLLMQLLWKMDFIHLKPRPPIYRAPSWSWASTDGRVELLRSGKSWEVVVAKVVECETVPLDSNMPFGLMVDGWLTLDGPTHRGTYRIEDGKPNLIAWQSGRIDWCDIDPDIAQGPGEGVAEFIVLTREPPRRLVHRHCVRGLVLEITGGSTYRRVGTFTGYELRDPALNSPIVREPLMKRVKII